MYWQVGWVTCRMLLLSTDTALHLSLQYTNCPAARSSCSVIKCTWPFMASMAASALGRPMNCTNPHPLPAGIFTYTISPKRWKIALSWSSVTCRVQRRRIEN
jgi:hypothetical protein